MTSLTSSSDPFLNELYLNVVQSMPEDKEDKTSFLIDIMYHTVDGDVILGQLEHKTKDGENYLFSKVAEYIEAKGIDHDIALKMLVIQEKEIELHLLCDGIGTLIEKTYGLGRHEFSSKVSSVFNELKEHAKLRFGQLAMYSVLIAEIESLSAVKNKIASYREYPFWMDVAIKSTLFINKKLDQKSKKLKMYLKEIPVDDGIVNCSFWKNITASTGVKL